VRPLRRRGEGPAEICELLHDEVVTKERDRQRDRDRLRDMAGLVKTFRWSHHHHAMCHQVARRPRGSYVTNIWPVLDGGTHAVTR